MHILVFEGPASRDRLFFHLKMRMDGMNVLQARSCEDAENQVRLLPDLRLVVTDGLADRANPRRCGAALYPLTSATAIPRVIVSSLVEESEGYVRTTLGFRPSSDEENWHARASGVDRRPLAGADRLWLLFNGFEEGWMELSLIKHFLLRP